MSTSTTVARTMFRGDSLVFVAAIKDSNGDAYNLTGAEIYVTAKYGYPDADEDAVFQATVTNQQVTITDVAAGTIEVSIPAGATASLPDVAVTLVYDMKLRDGAGLVSTVEQGTITVGPSATRSTS